MSSCPGYKLEDYISWLLDITVEGGPESNVSIGIAEMLGNVQSTRQHLTKDQFAELVAIYEPIRDSIEEVLLDFDEETQSWRMYGSMIDENYISESTTDLAQTYLDSIKRARY